MDNKCTQCDRPAVVAEGQHPLCISCYSLLQQTETARMEATNDHLRLLAAHTNHLLDEMAAATGLNIGQSMKISIPARSAQQYNTIHSVSVQGGVVGLINTGQVHKIDVAIGDSEKNGNVELSTALKAFTEALISEKDIQKTERRDLVDQLSLISDELTTSKDARRPGVITAVLNGIAKSVATSASLVELWDKLHPLLTQALR